MMVLGFNLQPQDGESFELMETMNGWCHAKQTLFLTPKSCAFKQTFSLNLFSLLGPKVSISFIGYIIFSSVCCKQETFKASSQLSLHVSLSD